ncbi:MAG TPA: endonuclease/exonuclease/phosphatase family protein [Flavisolibacter sp.]|nr:endonuclease/exonuclease/phosphatase family protein [Flavisolibacter sp.]
MSQTTAPTDSLRVVTFNIRKAEKIELATAELQQLQKTKNIDVFLLQEMDEQGAAAIAKSLGLNYLYIPIVYRTSAKKDVGNAILTKGAIECPEKLLLPHAKPLSKSRRLVTIAEVTVNQEKILVYSVQTETVVMSRKKRMDQVEAILEHVRLQAPSYKYVLIGGDFNTLFTKSSKLAIDKFRGNGFDWSTATVGTTARAFFGFVKPRHDYIFSKGLRPMNASKMEASKSSDHYPVLATFSY